MAVLIFLGILLVVMIAIVALGGVIYLLMYLAVEKISFATLVLIIIAIAMFITAGIIENL